MALLATFLTLLLIACNADSQVDAQTINEPSHPRIFFTEADIPFLREQAQTSHVEIWQPIIEYVDTIVTNRPPDTPPAISDNDWRDLGNDMIPLAFACLITDEDLYCDATIEHMLIYASYNRWNAEETRDLGLAHMITGNALAYDWLYSRLSDDERLIIRRQLAHNTQKMYQASAGDRTNEWGNWWRESYLQNHYWINNSAIGLASIVLADENLDFTCEFSALNTLELRETTDNNSPVLFTIASNTPLIAVSEKITEDATIWWQIDNDSWLNTTNLDTPANCNGLNSGRDAWLSQATSQIALGRFILDGIGDGTWHESIHYQNYLMTMTLPFIINAREHENIDLFAHEYFQEMINVRIYNAIPDTTQPLLSYGDFDPDWGAAYAPQHLLRFMAREYDNAYAEWLAQEISAVDRIASQARAPWYVFEFFYYDPSIQAQAPDDTFPLSTYLPDLDAVIWRTGWDDDSIAFGLKSGAYGGRFAYDTFVQNTVPWDAPCVSTGCQLNIGHDHDDTNTFYLAQGNAWLATEQVNVGDIETALHNTITINGQGQSRPTSSGSWRDPVVFEGAEGIITVLANTSDFDYLVSDASMRYPDTTIQNLTRHVLFVRPYYFIMIDNIQAEDIQTYEWSLHGGGSISLMDGWIRTDAENDNVLAVGVAAPSEYLSLTGSDEHPFVRIRPLESLDDVRFINMLYPTQASEWDNRPQIEVLMDTVHRGVLRVDRTMTDGLIDEIIIRYNSSTGLELEEFYSYDGNAAVLTFDTDDNLTRLLLVGGTFLKELNTSNDDNLIQLDSNEAAIQIDFDQDIAYISGTYTGAVRLYAPSITNIQRGEMSIEFEREGDFIYFDLPRSQNIGN